VQIPVSCNMYKTSHKSTASQLIVLDMFLFCTSNGFQGQGNLSINIQILGYIYINIFCDKKMY